MRTNIESIGKKIEIEVGDVIQTSIRPLFVVEGQSRKDVSERVLKLIDLRDNSILSTDFKNSNDIVERFGSNIEEIIPASQLVLNRELN